MHKCRLLCMYAEHKIVSVLVVYQNLANLSVLGLHIFCSLLKTDWIYSMQNPNDINCWVFSFVKKIEMILIVVFFFIVKHFHHYFFLIFVDFDSQTLKGRSFCQCISAYCYSLFARILPIRR